MDIELAIKENIAKVFKDKFNESVVVQNLKLEPTNTNFKGDYTFNVFPYLKISKLNPEETAKTIGNMLLQESTEIVAFNVVKGFLNIEVSASAWLNNFKKFTPNIQSPNRGKIMVEYSSPNTNKPLHLGHIRTNLLGYSVAQMLKFVGNDVVMVNLVNDRGIHICKSMLAWQLYGNGETPENTGIKGDHLVGKYYVLFDKYYKEEVNQLIANGIDKEKAEKQAPMMLKTQEMLRKWEAGDEEVMALWQTMNGWVYNGFDKTYKALGVYFDKYYYESNTYLLGKDIVSEGLAKNIFYKKPDGSVWIDLTADGLDEKLVMRADGTSVYITQDIGTAQLKYDEYGCEKSIYVVGNEQDYHFKVLFLILNKLGKPWASGCYHLSYGMVDLPSGKMKSREGTVVDADDLMAEMNQTAQEKTEELGKTDGMSEDEKQRLYDMLGKGALKFFMLRVDPQKRMLFNPQESIDFQGDTGPFVQYTFARINSILKAADPSELQANYTLQETKESEINVVKHLLSFEKTIIEAAQNYNPAAMCNYVLNLAKAFNRMYNDVPLVKESDAEKRKFRLQVSEKTAQTIKIVLKLMGIECPDRM